MQKLILAATAAAACLIPLSSAAEFQKPEDAIKYRQSTMFVMAQHFGRVAAMAAGKAPFDAKAAAENAALANMMAPLPYAGFGPGTESGAPTRAKPEIWTDPEFNKIAETMQTAMAKLAEVAKGGDLAQIKAAAGETGKACKSCHDDFRNEKFSAK